jgi:tetratricopeptide (TPR) repeat protein
VAKTRQRISAEDQRRAVELNTRGLKHFKTWDIAEAIADFEAAAHLAPNHADYWLNHARALARSGDYDRALKSLAEFIRIDKDPDLVERYERFFANAMDDVETLLTQKMTAAELPMEEIGAAIQMWLEYRITIGRQALVIRKPEAWAAALDFTIRRVNLKIVPAKDVAAYYGISEPTLRDRHHALIKVLDIMPCDYRYFAGKDNPLDKLVEAAEMLAQLEDKFLQP